MFTPLTFAGSSGDKESLLTMMTKKVTQTMQAGVTTLRNLASPNAAAAQVSSCRPSLLPSNAL